MLDDVPGRFNSKDGAIDSQSLAPDPMTQEEVSIPKMVRLIVNSQSLQQSIQNSFNSKDGAIDRVRVDKISLHLRSFNSKDGAIDRVGNE